MSAQWLGGGISAKWLVTHAVRPQAFHIYMDLYISVASCCRACYRCWGPLCAVPRSNDGACYIGCGLNITLVYDKLPSLPLLLIHYLPEVDSQQFQTMDGTTCSRELPCWTRATLVSADNTSDRRLLTATLVDLD